jgi:hypothetical protein
MAYEIQLPTHGDARGKLTVIDSILPFPVVRVYYIYGCSDEPRGGHRHRKTRQALACVSGSCAIDWSNGAESGTSRLDSPETLLILEPEDWHVMRDFSPDAVLLVLASEHFDPEDYISEGYGR